MSTLSLPKRKNGTQAPDPRQTLHGLLRRYVGLESVAKRYSPGEVPPQIQHELDSLQAQYATLPHHLQLYATRQLNEIRTVNAEADRIQSRTAEQARRLRAGNKELALRFKDTLGANKPLTVKEYAQILEGADKLTVKTNKTRFDREKVMEAFRPHLKSLGLPENSSYKRVVEFMDNLVSDRRAQEAGESDRYLTGIQSKGITLDLQELDDVVSWWDENSFNMAWTEHLAEKDKDIPDTEEIEVTDDLLSRVTAASESVEAAMDSSMNRDAFDEAASGFRQDTLEDEGMRGDVARAWLRTEAGDSFGARQERGEVNNPLSED